jgi:peptidoglycan/LPS O-acetylase OafA/YrhL
MGEIKALTSLRGIAAMMVVMQHFSATAQEHSRNVIPSLVPHGYIAVDLFFVLSGFIMAYTYLDDFRSRGWLAFPTFIMKRVARIVPLNTFAVLLVLILGAVSSALIGRDIFHGSSNILFDGVANLLMLQGLGIGLNLNGPSWSISTEFATYFVFPLLIGVVFNRSRFVAVGAVFVCFVVLGVMAAGNHRLGLDSASIEGGVIRCVTEFMIGLGTYRLTLSPRFRGLLEKDRTAAIVIAWIGVVLLLRIDFLVVCGFPVLIGALAYNRARVAALFETQWAYFLGVISFSIYLLHNPMRPIWLTFIRFVHPEPMSTALALIVAFVCSLSVIPFAWLAYVVIEKPGRRIIRGATRARAGQFARL